MESKRYPTDLSDDEWRCLRSHLPEPAALLQGRPRPHSLREILDAIFYVPKSGCAWRLLPHDFPTAGRASTTTSVSGAWTERGRGCTPPYVSACGCAWRGTRSPAQPSWIASRSRPRAWAEKSAATTEPRRSRDESVICS